MRVELVWASVAAGHLDGATRAGLEADVDDVRLAKLQRFHRQEDRDRGLAAHALLRRELVALVGGSPAGLRLQTRCAACGSREHGKPELPGRPVEFNLSHSGDLVCVALAPAGAPVGVDVEQLRAVNWTALRRSVFADAEWTATAAAPDPDAARTQVWARKEAAVKASGHGLALPLRRVDVAAGHPWVANLGDGRPAATGWDVRLGASGPDGGGPGPDGRGPGPDGPGQAPPHAAAVAVLLPGDASDPRTPKLAVRHVVLT